MYYISFKRLLGQPNITVILPLSTSLVLASRHFLATSRKGEPEGCFAAFLAATEAAIELVGAELADKQSPFMI